jgi:stage V sporulation protein B
VLITIPCFVGLYLLAKPISEMIYHAPRAADSVSILSVGIFLLGIHQVTTGVLQGMGHTTIPVVNMGLSAVVKVILNWVLTASPSLGIQGAAWATVADVGVAAILNMYFVHRYVGFTMDYTGLGKTIVAAAAMGALVYLVYNWVLASTVSMAMATIAAMIVGAIVYSVVLLIIGGVNERDLSQMPMFGAALVKLLRRIGFFKLES